MRALSTWAIVLALAVLHGCGSEAPPDAPYDATEWVESVERAHRTADVEPAEAASALRQALAMPVPSDVRVAHRRVVQQDLLFRIARVELAATHLAEALAAADRGLALGAQLDMFTANLWIARGEALERLGRDTEAAAAYYEALEINRKLLHHVLRAKDAGTP